MMVQDVVRWDEQGDASNLALEDQHLVGAIQEVMELLADDGFRGTLDLAYETERDLVIFQLIPNGWEISLCCMGALQNMVKDISQYTTRTPISLFESGRAVISWKTVNSPK